MARINWAEVRQTAGIALLAVLAVLALPVILGAFQHSQGEADNGAR